MTSTETGVTPYIDPRKSALLVIDMQEGFCSPKALMETSGIGTSNQRAIIPKVAELVKVAREHAVPVFWSQQVHFPEDVTRARRLDTIPGHMDKQNFAPCLRGTWEVDFVPEMDVRDEDYVIEKHRASMFQETTLAAKVRMLGI
ncbi:MAG: ureidoacrylate peracid hydrolase, partial [Solirubrobacterales bacterium]|nr:ureidoacrylate peracid hydrolase [Solirubrobacterales bacterium]